MYFVIAEQAVERYYATVRHQHITDALATLTTSDAAGNHAGQLLDPVQLYRGCTDDQRRLLNQALFRQLHLAEDRIIDHEPWPATPLTETTPAPTMHDTLGD